MEIERKIARLPISDEVIKFSDEAVEMMLDERIGESWQEFSLASDSLGESLQNSFDEVPDPDSDAVNRRYELALLNFVMLADAKAAVEPDEEIPYKLRWAEEARKILSQLEGTRHYFPTLFKPENADTQAELYEEMKAAQIVSGVVSDEQDLAYWRMVTLGHVTIDPEAEEHIHQT